MNIGYIHLDYGEWTTGSYNIQEIGLAKALEQMGHQTTIVYWMYPLTMIRKRGKKRCFNYITGSIALLVWLINCSLYRGWTHWITFRTSRRSRLKISCNRR